MTNYICKECPAECKTSFESVDLMLCAFVDDFIDAFIQNMCLKAKFIKDE